MATRLFLPEGYQENLEPAYTDDTFYGHYFQWGAY